MRILIGSSSPVDDGAGINAYVKESAAEFRRLGHHVTLASPSSGRESWFAEHDIAECSIARDRAPKSAVSYLYKFLIDLRVDLIINNDNAFVQCLAPVSPCVFLSVVHMERTTIGKLATYNRDWIDYVVTISNSMRYQILRRENLPAHRVPLIYNGIDHSRIDELRRNSRSKNLPTRAGLRAVFTGGSSRWKGIDKLKELLTMLEKSGLDCEVNVFGSITSNDRTRLEKFSNSRVHGRVSHGEMLNAFLEADLFLAPSRVEGCPMSLIEAMSAGLVPIVSDGVGAMDVMVRSSMNGFVCPLTNWGIEAFSCIAQLMQAPDLLASLSRAAAVTARTSFSIDRNIQALLTLAKSPTVSRAKKPTDVVALKWHRPTTSLHSVSGIVDRIAYLGGCLRTDGRLRLG